MLIINSCHHTIGTSHPDPINVSVVFHVRDQIDVIKNIPIMLEVCRKAFEGTGIELTIMAIYTDVPERDVEWKGDASNFRAVMNEQGVVHVFLIDKAQDRSGDGLAGLQVSRHCDNFILITNDQQEYTIAHEIGHFYGLIHIKNNRNIMHNGSRINPSFNDRQINRMINHIKRYDALCRE